MLRGFRNASLFVAPCSALVLGGCFSDPPVAEMGETMEESSTGALTTGSTGGPGSGSTEPDPSVSTSGGTTIGPEPTGSSTGQTTVADSGASSSGSSSSTTGPIVVCEPFFDTFGEKKPLDGWTYSDAENADVVDGHMVLTVTPPTGDVNKMEILGGWTGADGSTVTVELGQLPMETDVNQMIRFTSTDPTPDLVTFRVQQVEAGPQLQVWHATNNANFQEPASVPFNPLQHQWLRVQENDNTLLFETSGDGTNFAEFYEMDDSFDLDGAAVGIAVTNFQPLTQVDTASFASFDLSCPE